MPLFNPSPPLWSYKSQYWYHPQGSAGATQLIVAGTITFAPLVVPQPMMFDQIGLEVTTAASTNSVTRLGIYGDVSGTPGPLILDAGTIPSSCVAGTSVIPITQGLGPGVFWLAAVGQTQSTSTINVVTQPTVRRISTDNSIVGMSSPAVQFAGGWNQTGTTGALPANATVTSISGGPSLVMLRSL